MTIQEAIDILAQKATHYFDLAYMYHTDDGVYLREEDYAFEKAVFCEELIRIIKELNVLALQNHLNNDEMLNAGRKEIKDKVLKIIENNGTIAQIYEIVKDNENDISTSNAR